MSTIDWSKPPLDAEFAREWMGRVTFFKSTHDGAFWHEWTESNPKWVPTPMGNAIRASLELRPAPWDGEGLPPVGTVCELSSQGADWGIGTIQYTAENVIVWRWERQAEGQACARYRHEVEIRPIRTPEQIAEEERVAGLNEMIRCIKDHPHGTHGVSHLQELMIHEDVARDLWDAGYRKQEAP